MRLIKMFGLAAIAAVAAMAFVGAGSASAANTQLCKSHAALTCSSGASSAVMTNAGVGILLNSLANILCLSIAGSGKLLALADPQQVHITALSFIGCGTNAEHDNCEIEATELPLANLNKTGLDMGTLTLTNGSFSVACENVIFSTDIECEYDGTDLEFPVGSQHLTADDTSVAEIGSDFLCPNNPTLDGLLVTTASRYVLA